MSVAARQLFAFDNSFVRELEGLYVPWQGQAWPAPELLILNEPLAHELGADPAALRSADGVAALAGSRAPDGAAPVAQAYAGHQFGGFVPRLGDGRALLLGEVIGAGGGRRDLHLKGSGRTPFARGGDGKAAIGPMLREYVIGEAMHALGIPTTRALAVVATGEDVLRERALPGAVLARVGASHIRVGTFQYALLTGGAELVRRLADHVIARHHPAAQDAENRYLALFEAVVEAQASLIAQWMRAGFIHGVMNTDNMAISGETIDYGPCAFIDVFDPETVFSSIDHGGRYAFGNQPAIAQWNLARLGETLLDLLGDGGLEAATAVLNTFPGRFERHWLRGMRAKLGLTDEHPDDGVLIADLLDLMRADRVDYTRCMRALGGRGARSQFSHVAEFDRWQERWLARAPARETMDRHNAIYIPRNHLVEAALTAATGGDLAPLHELLAAVTQPYDERPGLERYAEPASAEFGEEYQTFCGT